MQQSQVADHALTLHIGDDSDCAPLRIVVDPPAIEQKDGVPVLTITLSVVWGTNRPQRDHASRLRLQGNLAQELLGHTHSVTKPEAQSFRVPSRFRNWYLCDRDGAEWSLEVDDPTLKDSCPICSGRAGAIAVLGLPIDTREEKSEESVSRFKLCRPLSFSSLSHN
jgi:hypothetical protein